MRYNPCGRAVDWSRTSYTTKARLHNSPDAPLIDVLWYFTDLDFLDQDLAFNNRVWDSDDVRQLAPGEAFPIAKKFAKPRVFIGLNGEHQCGTPDDFQFGQPWPYTGPVVAYDPDGIPACCDRDFAWGPTTGSAPSGEVTLNCSSYEITCNGETVTMNNLVLDGLWRGSGAGGQEWTLANKRGEPLIPVGFWILKKTGSAPLEFYGKAAWNGRGSTTFTYAHLPGGGCASSPLNLVVTGSCT